jgi:hypothetical protein
MRPDPCIASRGNVHLRQMETAMEERRKAPRERTFLNGRIAFNNKNSTNDCFVKNCSDEGAKITVGETLPLPHEFDFLIPGRRESRRARLVWRQGTQAGLTFVA